MAFGHGKLKGEFQNSRGELFFSADAAHSAHIGQERRIERDQDLLGTQSGARESIIKSGAAANRIIANKGNYSYTVSSI